MQFWMQFVELIFVKNHALVGLIDVDSNENDPILKYWYSELGGFSLKHRLF